MLMRVFACSMGESGHTHVMRKRFVAACVIVLMAIASCRDSQERSTDRSGSLCEACNVVLISMDTLRADHVGAYGYPRPVTPAIDRLAGDGVLFEDAIGQSAWTRPSHFSMFTGLYPIEHGVVGMAGRSRLAEGTPTLASSLRAAGWRTVRPPRPDLASRVPRCSFGPGTGPGRTRWSSARHRARERLRTGRQSRCLPSSSRASRPSGTRGARRAWPRRPGCRSP